MDYVRKQKETEKLSRVCKIYEHPLFKDSLARNCAAERERIFCRHDMAHFLDVARLSYIFALERNYPIEKEEIYAAALLHDIGRWRQYGEGIPHEEAGAEIAERILEACGFTKEETGRILDAVLEHRGEEPGGGKMLLAEVLCDADKLSRACYACPAEKECNWSEEKKNLKPVW